MRSPHHFGNYSAVNEMRYAKNKTGIRGVDNYHMRSAVKVECGRNVGTAVCVHSSGTAGSDLFLTCAHVVQYKTQSVTLRYDGYAIRAKAIYSAGVHDPNDIAVIASERNAVNIVPCEISNELPSAGQKVFTVGYARDGNAPAMALGRVHKSSFNTITTSCNVCIGFSGGPVFTSNSQLLGLTVGKLSVGTVHIVLPSTKFVAAIKKYILTDDPKVLDNLESRWPLKKIWNRGIPHRDLMCHI